MLVEDDPDDEALTLRVLRKRNLVCAIDVARDGAEALKKLLGDGETGGAGLPQVVLLDLKLPKVDGLEVLKCLRENERTATMPVVVLTSSDEERDIVQSYRLGANSYVRKPVDFEDFASAVDQLGLYWLALNRVPESTR
ncbi:MAG: response regulator [Chitinivibrionales bacterium]|nr:response regulator [Chitinivibrionales bacterium]